MRVLLGFFCACGLATALPVDDSAVALLQSVVHLHNMTNTKVLRAHFLVDNSNLKHSGPGVLLRKSKRLDDTMGSDKYLKWGAVFEGSPAGDGWVKFQDAFLPTSLRGAQVISLKHVDELEGEAANTTVRREKKPIRFHYAGTQVEIKGHKFPCKILKAGRRNATYDIEVRPERFAAFNMTDVPAADLVRVRKIREFDPVLTPPSDPVGQPVSLNADVPRNYIHLVVNDTQGSSVKLKMLKTSPMRTAMKMACGKAGIPEFKCLKKVKFTWRGQALKADDLTSSLNMTDGATLLMKN